MINITEQDVKDILEEINNPQPLTVDKKDFIDKCLEEARKSDLIWKESKNNWRKIRRIHRGVEKNV